MIGAHPAAVHKDHTHLIGRDPHAQAQIPHRLPRRDRNLQGLSTLTGMIRSQGCVKPHLHPRHPLHPRSQAQKAGVDPGPSDWTLLLQRSGHRRLRQKIRSLPHMHCQPDPVTSSLSNPHLSQGFSARSLLLMTDSLTSWKPDARDHVFTVVEGHRQSRRGQMVTQSPSLLIGQGLKGPDQCQPPLPRGQILHRTAACITGLWNLPPPHPSPRPREQSPTVILTRRTHREEGSGAHSGKRAPSSSPFENPHRGRKNGASVS